MTLIIKVTVCITMQTVCIHNSSQSSSFASIKEFYSMMVSSINNKTKCRRPYLITYKQDVYILHMYLCQAPIHLSLLTHCSKSSCINSGYTHSHSNRRVYFGAILNHLNKFPSTRTTNEYESVLSMKTLSQLTA